MAVQFVNNPKVGDNVKIEVGDSSDLQIYHDATNSYVKTTSGNLIIQNEVNDADIIFKAYNSAGSLDTYFDIDGSAGVTKFRIDTRHLDNVEARFGASNDLKIYHDTTDSYITNTTGHLTISNTGDDLILKSADDFLLYVQGTELAIQAVGNSGVILRHNNVVKFETTSSGIRTYGDILIEDSSPQIHFLDTTNNNDSYIYSDDQGSLNISADENNEQNSSKVRFYIDGSEKVRFVSNGNVGIGETSVDAKLHITTATAGLVNQKFESAGSAAWRLGIPASQTYFAFDNANDNLSSPKLVINSSGFVGIGSTNPVAPLEVKSAETNHLTLYRPSNTTEGNAGSMNFDGNDSDSNQQTYAKIESFTDDATAGSHAGKLRFSIAKGGDGMTSAMTIKKDAQVSLNQYGSGSYTGTAAYTLQVDSAGNIIEGSTSGGGTVTGSGTATRVAFWSGTSALSSDANLYWDNTNDRLGIGTTAPSEKLDVAGNIHLSANQAYISFNTSASSGHPKIQMESDGDFSFLNTAGASSMIIENGGNVNFANNLYIPNAILHTGDTDTYLQFNGADSWRVVAGNVERLLVNTTSNTVRGSNDILRIQSTSTTGNPQISFYQTTTRRSFIQHHDSNDNLLIVSEYGGVIIKTGTGGTETEKMRIQADGNVGIGTTSPNETLSLYKSDRPYIQFISNTTGTTSSDGSFIGFATADGFLEIRNKEAQPIRLSTSDTERMRIDSGGAIQFNAYDSTNNTGTPTYLLGTDGSGNIVKTLATPGGIPTQHNLKSKAYTSLVGSPSSGSWFDIFTITDTMGPVNCKIFTYAHDSLEFSVAEGYGPSNGGTITIINSVHTPNGAFAIVSEVRIDQNGVVSIKLVWTSGPSVNIGINITGYNVPDLTPTLSVNTSTVTVVDSVNVDVTGMLRSKDQLRAGSNVLFDTNGDSYINGGDLGIGTTSPDRNLHIYQGNSGVTGYAITGGIDIESTSTSGINILSPNAGYGRIYFGAPISNTAGAIEYIHNATLASGYMKLRAGGADRLVINSLGIDILGGNIAVDESKGFNNSGAWTRNQTPSGYIEFGPANTSWAHIYTDRPNFYFNKNLYVNGNLVWNAGNDGAGSGLDADLLDGQHGSYYAPATGGSYLPLSGGTMSGSINFGSSNGNINMSRGSFITFYEDSNTNHSIGSRSNTGVEADDIRINTYGALYVNLDSNNNNTSGADFMIGRHGAATGTISELFRVSGEDGDVGIGVTNPEGKFHVVGPALGNSINNTSTDAVFQSANANQALLSIQNYRTSAGTDWTSASKRIQMRIDSTHMGWMQFNGTGNNGGISWGAGTSTTQASITEKMRLTSAGRLGIGDSPSYKLDVNAGTDNNIARFHSSDDTAQIIIKDNDTTMYFGARNSVGYISPTGSTPGNGICVDTSSQVGIGTASPNTKLHVSSDAGFPQIRFQEEGNSEAVGLRFQAKNSAEAQVYADIKFDPDSAELIINNPYNSGTQGLTVDSSSNVLVGNDLYVPDQIIHTGDTDTYLQFNGADSWRVVIAGTETIEANSTRTKISSGTNEILRLSTTSATGSPYISFYQSTTRRSYIQSSDTSAGDNLDIASEYGNVRIMTGTNGTETEKMVIQADGDVGIGVTNPVNKLHVGGKIYSSGDIQANSELRGATLRLPTGGTSSASDFSEMQGFIDINVNGTVYVIPYYEKE